MDATEATALSVCAAGMTVAAGAALASCIAPPIQLLTVTEIVDIDELLEDPRGEGWFTKNIRCSSVTFFGLLEFLRSRNFEFKNLTHKEHSFAKRVAGVLYFLASSGTYRATASSMGMNESVLFESVDELTAFLVGILDEVVKFPDILGDWRRIEHGFKRKQGIPGVIGAVDGSLFQIQRPADYEGFYCRKGYTAIKMQAIVDTDLKFMAIDMYPGSWSDKKVWNIAPSSSLVRTKMPVETRLIGDSGYTLYPWLLTPFIEREEGGRLSDRQKRFNKLHSSTRMSLEIAFGHLKGRFCRLKTVMAEKTLHKACRIIAAPIVMHNIFILLGDGTEIDEAIEPTNNDSNDEYTLPTYYRPAEPCY